MSTAILVHDEQKVSRDSNSKTNLRGTNVSKRLSKTIRRDFLRADREHVCKEDVATVICVGVNALNGGVVNSHPCLGLIGSRAASTPQRPEDGAQQSHV